MNMKLKVIREIYLRKKVMILDTLTYSIMVVVALISVAVVFLARSQKNNHEDSENQDCK